ncbi:tRNA (5-methylaminomethyl-2-thiouridine)(34)-methyltransferase MnmD [Hydrogenophaga sp.]|uniref:tRNA (5-methylaminomethyl-2-thiouridine)(34)-methyltransferase MnmD n=1 Tax=Hydrogenophaga sp. TaxID=1904254 RepID=UPI00261E7590|nr:tRNA (5-methylaminomethyl-2-thiouridine)(34)-methyltransferase MnmD [Hydrogenophaga sp.]MCW5655677.1 tRNA (5-methylaminomethyl-2-thiouridine)(34)-methyltransferase MnmD [Hydrogenophaga sp.]
MSDAVANEPESPVAWDAQGMPFSVRFGDRYRSEGQGLRGGLAQARHVFLAGCRLAAPDGQPAADAAWRGARCWRVLENGFGLGLNFLATWQAWRHDPHRPGMLQYDATEAWPPSAHDVRRSVQPFPDLEAQAHALADAWPSLLSHGTSVFEGGRVQLRLHLGDAVAGLSRIETGVHSIYLDGFDPRLNPGMWSADILRTIGSLAHPGAHAATWCVARTVRDGLAYAGFKVKRREGLPPKRHCLAALRTDAA